MAQGSLGKALRRTLLRLGGSASVDGQLLERFVARHDEAAFAELVQRHGPMVFRVCQRVLRHAQDAEDAFQATFIVLARKAESVSPPDLLPNWLYGVAVRVALEARAVAVKRRAREMLTDEPGHDLEPDAQLRSEQAWRSALDEELRRLPDKYRVSLVLCYLEGKTAAETAQALGCQTGAIEKRLSRGRNLLRQRLERRGLALTATALAALLAEEAAGTVPPALAAATSRTAVLAVTGKAFAAVGSADALAASALKEMSRSKIKLAATVAVLAVVAPVSVMVSLPAMKPVAATSGSLTATTGVTATASTPVTLTRAFNRVGIVSDGAIFSSGLDGPHSALSARLLGSSITWNGNTFNLGTPNSNNVIRAAGQTIHLPAGNFTTLSFLAAGFRNQPNQTFIVTYADDTTQAFTQSISDWYMPQEYRGETSVVTMAYRNLYNGTRDTLSPFYVYGYSFDLNSTKTVKSLTLPNNGNVGSGRPDVEDMRGYVVVLAVTLGSQSR
jgi:RNA polymerase sigma factor (sigma-70 family)